MPIAPSQRVPLLPPLRGLHEGVSYDLQPDHTTSLIENIRFYDALKDRARMGSRLGLSKINQIQMGDDVPIQWLTQVSTAVDTGSVQNGRAVLLHDTAVNTFVTASQLTGAQIFTFDVTTGTVSEIKGVRDREGNYYIAIGGTSTTWTGNDGSSKNLWKVNTAGQVLWSALTTSTNVLAAIAYDEEQHRVVIAGDVGAATDGIVECYDADTGAMVWSFSTGVMSADADSGRIVVDDNGNTFVGYGRPRTDWDTTDGTAANLWKLDDTGTVLAKWGSASSGAIAAISGLDVHADGSVVTAIHRASTTWIGNDGSSKDVFLLTNSLVVTATYLKGDSGGGITDLVYPHCAFLSGGDIILTGALNGTTDTVVRFTQANSTVWSMRMDGPGGDASDVGLAISDNDRIFVLGTTNSTWTGAGGNSANLLRLDPDDGTAVWFATVGSSAIRSTIEVGPKRTALNTRKSSLVMVVDGTVKVLSEGLGTVPFIPTGGSAALDSDLFVIQSASLFNHVVFVDGSVTKVYDVDANTVATMTATAGSVPVAQRLACAYRGRIVLAGSVADPHNYFMSKSGDIFDWDYAPATPTALDAVAGNLSEVGVVGDIITTLIPFGDDVLIFGCDHSIWRLQGDPAAGGTLTLVSDKTGIAWGTSWAKDQDGVLYFVGNDGLYRMTVGGAPESITRGRVDSRFRRLDFVTRRALLEWNTVRYGLVVHLAGEDNDLANESLFWDARLDAWTRDIYPAQYGPCSILAYDGDQAEDKALLFGCKDGYLRFEDSNADDDDGITFESKVRYPAMHTPMADEKLLLQELVTVLGTTGTAATMKVYSAETAEHLRVDSSLRFARTLQPGRNITAVHRVADPYIQVELGFNGTQRWAVENVVAKVQPLGKSRRHKR